MYKAFELRVAAESNNLGEVKYLLSKNATVLVGTIDIAIIKGYTPILAEILIQKPELKDAVYKSCVLLHCTEYFTKIEEEVIINNILTGVKGNEV